MKFFQLPLVIQPHAEMNFSNFHPAENKLAVAALTALFNTKNQTFIYLWGSVGSGRSHLLQACCHTAVTLQQTYQYLPLLETSHYPAQIIEGFEHSSLICIDDIDIITGNHEWEEGLFHLYNRIQLLNQRLVITAKVPPAQLAIQLADLKSRLSSGLVIQLHDLNDNDKIAVLQIHAKRRGLDLPFGVANYLLKRNSRTLPGLINLLEQLDLASLAAQRKLTIPFVKNVLNL